MNWQNIPWTLFDFETSGLDVEKDRIWEIGLVQCWNGVIKHAKCIRVNPEVSLSKEIVEKCHLTLDDLASIRRAPKFKDVARFFVPKLLNPAEPWTPYYTEPHAGLICGHNILNYDLPLLKHELLRSGWNPIEVEHIFADLHKRAIDSIPLAREALKHRQRKNLPETAAYLGVTVQLDGKTYAPDELITGAHNALFDCLMDLSVLQKLASALPEDVEEAVDQLQAWNAVHQAQFAKYSYWLREEDNQLFMNCGKHFNNLLRNTPKNYLSYLLRQSQQCSNRLRVGRPKDPHRQDEWDTPLPETVFRLFSQALRGAV